MEENLEEIKITVPSITSIRSLEERMHPRHLSQTLNLRWKQFTTKGKKHPSPRSSFCFCGYQTYRIFIQGGCDNKSDLNDGFTLNLHRRKWKPICKLSHQISKPLVGHSAILVNQGNNPKREALCLFGGWNGNNYSNKTYFIDTRFFEVLESSEGWVKPNSRRDHTLTVDKLDDKLYLLGGWNALDWNYTEGTFGEVWTLNNKWEWKKEELYKSPPCSRRGHTCIHSYLPVLSLIVFGGVYGYNKFLDDLYLLDLTEKTWNLIETHGVPPSPRAWHSASLLSIYMVIFGGLLPGDVYSNSLFTLQLNSWTWAEVNLPDGPSARCSHAAVTVHSSILIFGGVTNIGDTTERCNLTQIYVLETGGSTMEEYVNVIQRRISPIMQDPRTWEGSNPALVKKRIFKSDDHFDQETGGKRLAGAESPKRASTDPVPDMSFWSSDIREIQLKYGGRIRMPEIPSRLKQKKEQGIDRANLGSWNSLIFPDCGSNLLYRTMKMNLSRGEAKLSSPKKLAKTVPKYYSNAIPQPADKPPSVDKAILCIKAKITQLKSGNLEEAADA